MRSERTSGIEREDGEQKDRRTLIAEAVITLLGTEGSRGLSHRAVDSFLCLPPGSTNYYFRNKADLLMAGFEELIRQQTHATEEYNQFLFGDAFVGEPVRVMADKEHRSWKRVNEPDWKPTVLARYEFFLMASRNAELQAMQTSVMRKSFMVDIVAFTLAGAKNPCRAAAELGDMRRGNYTTFFLVPAARWGRELDLAYFERKISGIIRDTDEFDEDLQRF